MGSSPKVFPWKIKKQTRDLGTIGSEKTADSSFSQQHENDVTGKKRSVWDFSWGRSGAQHWIWNLSRNKEGEWGQQSLRHVESPGRTRFQNQQAVNMAVLKMADEPKPRSEACWLSRRGAEGEDSAGREELCGPTWAVPAMRPGMAGKCFSLPGWETGCVREALVCKKYIYSHEQMDVLDIRSQNLNLSQPCSAWTLCWQLHFPTWNRYFRGTLPNTQEILLKSIWQTVTSFQRRA